MKISLRIITFFLFMIVGKAYSQKAVCPFQYFYQMSDGITDIGDSVRTPLYGPLLPPTRPPYGRTYPGSPTGRWSDGNVTSDYAARAMGLPKIKPFLSLDTTSSYNGVVFSVARSTILDTPFFTSRGINVPPYNTPINSQINRFKSYINPIICNNPKDCMDRKPRNAVVEFKFAEANDLAYALVQGRSIQEVTSYVPLIVKAQVDAAREVIRQGVTRFVFNTAAPIGCFPYILTALSSNDPTAYDKIGCLRAVNDLVIHANAALMAAFDGLKAEFRTLTILGLDYYTLVKAYITQLSVMGMGTSVNPALKSCCGTGGRYNYDVTRFCGTANVPVCPDPNNYVFWDGLHFTQEAHLRIISPILPVALALLNCTSST